MTTYQHRIEHYGPDGLIDTEVIDYELTGEAEQRHLSPERIRNAYQTLRQWSADAATNHTNWPTMTNAQKDAAQRETIRRLGILMDRLADLLLLEGRT
jgi:hypothetical protein